MEKVTLKKPHTHAGVEHAAGEEIVVTLVEARWLLDHKIIGQLQAAAKSITPKQ